MSRAGEKATPLYDGRSRASESAQDARPDLARRRDPRRRRRLLRRVKVGGKLFLLLLFIALVISRSLVMPSPYQAELSSDNAQRERDGRRLELALADFHNDLQIGSDWQLEIEQDALNGWLGQHLPRKFPGRVPSGVSSPRVMMGHQQFTIYTAFQWCGFDWFITATFDCFLTDEANVIAVRVKSFRSGWIPLPIGPWTSAISRSLSHLGLRVRWGQDSGSATALISVPDRLESDQGMQLSVRQVSLSDGRLIITGTKLQADAAP